MLRVEALDEGRIEVWTFDRPDAANAIDRATADQLGELVARAEGSATLRAVVLAAAKPTTPGRRRVFLSGADLREISSIEDEATARAFSELMTTLLSRLEGLPGVVVAAVAGDALGGGCELLTACDLRVLEEGVQLSFRQTRMGVTTGWGGSTRLLDLVGLGAAKRLLLTGLPCDAAEALRVGLADEVVHEGQALARALELARATVEGAPLAVAGLKRGLHEACELSRAASHARELDRFVVAWRSEDHREALAAVRERRAPRFRGR